jgi:asparagine synthase (glutamine-hydrolysing)
MRRRGLIRDVPIVTLSMTARTRAGDERRYVDAVVRRWGLTSHQVEPAVVAPEIFVDQVKRYRDMPEYPNVAAADALLSVARQEGCRTLLTGLGGDDWLCAPYFHGPELLAQGKLLEFVRQLRFEDGSAWPRSMAATFLRRGLWPLVPERWRGMVSAARARHGLPPHIADGFARATCLRERTKKPTMHRRRCPSRTQQELYDWFWGADLPYVNESEERHHAELGMEARHPFHDRRVIEFALAIPERQRWRAMQSKFVLRRALGDLLPAEVSSRETKGDYSHTIADALHAAGGDRCFERLESARRGWVRAGVVQETYRRMRALYEKGDEQYSTDAYGLWTVYGLDLWLTHAFD